MSQKEKKKIKLNRLVYSHETIYIVPGHISVHGSKIKKIHIQTKKERQVTNNPWETNIANQQS